MPPEPQIAVFGGPQAPGGKGSYPQGNSPDIHRALPHSDEAEQGLLGSMLIAPTDVIGECVESISGNAFYVPAHQTIYEILVELWNKETPADFITLTQILRDRKLLDGVGGPAFVTHLFTFTPTAANATYYREIVQEKFVLRQIITACTECAAAAYDEQGEVITLLGDVEQKVLAIGEKRFQNEIPSMTDQVMEAIETIEKLYERRGAITGIPTGFKDLDRMTSGFQAAEMIVIAARPSMGKCLAYDAEIVLASGEVVTIEEIFRRHHADLLTLGDDLRLGVTQPSDFIDDGVKPVFKVTTRLGRCVESTLPHPFLTAGGWKPLAELRPGMKIAVPRRVEIFGDCTAPDAEVKLLGYLLGDGGLTNSVPRFTNGNPVLLADFARAVEELGGLTTTKEDSRGARTPTLSVISDASARASARQAFAGRLRMALQNGGRPDRQVAQLLGVVPSCLPAWKQGKSVPTQPVFRELCRVLDVPEAELAPGGYASIAKNVRNALTHRLAAWGLMGCGSRDKFVPPHVFRLGRAELALFLNRLFSTDGWATVLASGQAQLGYASVSERLSRQVQHLLLRFGIIASLRRRSIAYQGTRRMAWQLDLTEAEAMGIFIAEIGIFGKEEAVLRVSEALATRKRYQTNCDLIPVEVWPTLAEAKGGVSWAALATASGLKNVTNLHVGQRALSRRRLSTLAATLEAPRLEHLATSDVYWDEIVSIEPAGDKQVYDLTIDGTHNFVANDICVHNTALAMNIAEHVAVNAKLPVAIFSLEMSTQQLVQRLLCSRARVNLQKVRDGFLSERDFPNLTNAADKLAKSQMYIDDTAGLSILELRAKARRLKKMHDIKLIVIDYLQLLRSTSRRAQDNRQLEIAEISAGIKGLAKELKLPIIVLAQLNRNPEARKSGRPMLSDLRESGSIEQDADVVALLVRSEYYAEEEDKQEVAGEAELIIAKQRNGPVGEVKLTFIKEFTRFEDRAAEARAS